MREIKTENNYDKWGSALWTHDYRIKKIPIPCPVPNEILVKIWFLRPSSLWTRYRRMLGPNQYMI